MKAALHNTRLFLELSESLLRGGNQFQFRAAGFSMHPTIRNGDLVRVARVSSDRIRVGDIILYQAGGAPTAHRVVRIESDRGVATRFITRGDSSLSHDEPVVGPQVLGKVVSVSRGGREVALGTRRAKAAGAMRSRAFRVQRWLRGRLAPVIVSIPRRLLAGPQSKAVLPGRFPRLGWPPPVHTVCEEMER